MSFGRYSRSSLAKPLWLATLLIIAIATLVAVPTFMRAEPSTAPINSQPTLAAPTTRFSLPRLGVAGPGFWRQLAHPPGPAPTR